MSYLYSLLKGTPVAWCDRYRLALNPHRKFNLRTDGKIKTSISVCYGTPSGITCTEHRVSAGFTKCNTVTLILPVMLTKL